MAALAELWALIGHLPHDPLVHLVLAAQILRPEAPRLLGDVHHDRARLEHRDRRAAALWSMVDHRRHAVVRVHLQKFGRELIAALDVAGDDLRSEERRVGKECSTGGSRYDEEKKV